MIENYYIKIDVSYFINGEMKTKSLYVSEFDKQVCDDIVNVQFSNKHKYYFCNYKKAMKAYHYVNRMCDMDNKISNFMTENDMRVRISCSLLCDYTMPEKESEVDNIFP